MKFQDHPTVQRIRLKTVHSIPRRKDRRPLMTIGLLAGWLTLVLMAGGCSKPAVKDPRLQSPRVEVFKAKAAG